MNEEEAILEANRCLNCANPSCVKGCPIGMNIPKFIEYIKTADIDKSFEIIKKKSYFGNICGRVCPHDKQCQGMCVRGIKGEAIKIGELEAFVCDMILDKGIDNSYKTTSNGIKIAIVGSGPAGLTCAIELRKLGYNVSIFEKEALLGGILKYGIPEYRLEKELVDKVIKNILRLNINIFNNVCLGKDFGIDDLWDKQYKAIFLAMGTELSKVLHIDGTNLNGVYGANEFIRNIKKYNFKNVVVIGGGNVAMDVARLAMKNCDNVLVIYRKEMKDMPANKKEVDAAIKEGIKFLFGKNILRINGEEKVESVTCDTKEEILCDTVVMAIGSVPNIAYIKDVKLDEKGLVCVDSNYETNINNVFAGGDLVQPKATVCMAIKTGIDAAIGIDKKMKEMKNDKK